MHASYLKHGRVVWHSNWFIIRWRSIWPICVGLMELGLSYPFRQSDHLHWWYWAGSNWWYLIVNTGPNWREITGSNWREITGSNWWEITGSNWREITGSNWREITGSNWWYWITPWQKRNFIYSQCVSSCWCCRSGFSLWATTVVAYYYAWYANSTAQAH